MDIAKMSMMLTQSQVQQEASLAVMGKAMGAAQQQANAVVQLMDTANVRQLQQAAEPHLGGNIDISV